MIIVANVSEPFHEFLTRTSDLARCQYLVSIEQSRGDRSLLWLETKKLVITSLPIHHLDYVKNNLGYATTEAIWPQNPTNFLSIDILNDSKILEKISSYIEKKNCIVPYATTPEFLRLISELERIFNCSIELPETPIDLWIRDYADSKIGFRTIANEAIKDSQTCVPAGFICTNMKEASRATQWFLSQNKACLIKANLGEAGLGNYVLRPNENISIDNILKKIEQYEFIKNDLIVVEELIEDVIFSPSIEFYVPPQNSGIPRMTYICNQILDRDGIFSGAEIYKHLYLTSWYPTLKNWGDLIAKQLQKKGYVGHFDIDTIVDKSEKLFLVEINARRTGATHVHEFALHSFGKDYIDRIALISLESISVNSNANLEKILFALRDLLFMPGKTNYGAIPTVTSSLSNGKISFMCLAESISSAKFLVKKVLSRLQAIS